MYGRTRAMVAKSGHEQRPKRVISCAHTHAVLLPPKPQHQMQHPNNRTTYQKEKTKHLGSRELPPPSSSFPDKKKTPTHKTSASQYTTRHPHPKQTRHTPTHPHTPTTHPNTHTQGRHTSPPPPHTHTFSCLSSIATSEAKWALYAASPAYTSARLTPRPLPRPVDGGAKSTVDTAAEANAGDGNARRLFLLPPSLTLGLTERSWKPLGRRDRST